MSEITLEKIDIIRGRLGVTYAEAKEALDVSEGNVVDALIYCEKNKKSTIKELYTTKEEFLNWIKDLIKTGSVTRIKIKKDDKVLIDIPVNAGILVTGFTLWLAPLVFSGSLIVAVVMKLTVEITKNDGSVEVVNMFIKDTMTDVKEKVMDVKDKVSEMASEVKDKITHKNSEDGSSNENVYKYTVKFEDIDEEEKNNQ